MKHPPCHCCGGTGVENDHANTGHELKCWRVSRNYTLTYVAGKLGISESLLCDLEHGRRNWTQERIKKYREVVNK